MPYTVPQAKRDEDYPMPKDVPSPPLVGKWGVLSYYVPSGLMHPDDIGQYLSRQQRGEELFQCVAEDGGFVRVQNDVGLSVRVNPHRFIWIPAPRFQIGESVRTRVGTPRVGWIARRCWHFKDETVYYLIDVPSTSQGRRHHTRRYLEHDIELSSDG